ncbi:hypothetical protein [Comamonas sp. NoAH]|uniref:hypothetical protein n=1 Tax=Comamonas halotolerans TaxID=3041496 RepID=UPI0024E1108B|nr:hypothetical protein [Comamonas sp. NoAH]
MIDRVPVPTDNIYKFYALFSLVVLIFCGWASFSKHEATNAIVFINYPQIEELKAVEKPTPFQVAKLAALELQTELAVKDRNFFNKLFGGCMAVALVVMFYGFKKWHCEIQPRADATNKAQLEILQLQIEKLKLENQQLSQSLLPAQAQTKEQRNDQSSILIRLIRLLAS